MLLGVNLIEKILYVSVTYLGTRLSPDIGRNKQGSRYPLLGHNMLLRVVVSHKLFG